MISNLAQGILVNLFVLMGFVALCTLIGLHAIRRQRTIPAWADGILFGLTAVVTMFVPVTTSPGVLFDCRSGVIGAAALLGGPVAALASLPLPLVYRFLRGGSGVLPGLLELVLPAIIGSLFYLNFRSRPGTLNVRRIIGASAVVALGTYAATAIVIQVFLSNNMIQIGVPGVLLMVLSAFVSMTLLCTLILLERDHCQAVTAVAESERRMLHSQKMAALGQLAGKVSHDFTNALTVILGNAQEAKELTAESPRITRLLDGILNTANRIARLSGELLTFAIPRPLRTQRLDLSKCLVGIEEILVRTMGVGIQVTLEANPAAGLVNIDPELIQQTVLHLAVNAKEAMSGHGRLVVVVAPAKLSDTESAQLQAGVLPENRHAGPFALLSVQDTGCGMTAETVSRIFEPFFTTKARSENAGLGLTTVYNIVRRHAGFIDVQTHPGHGTKFLIYLPAVA
jgi:signal transduction histidine kinase